MWLGVAGGIAELVGVVLAIREIRGRARKLTEYRTALAQVTAHGRIYINGEAVGAAVTAGESTLEERVDSLEARMLQVPTMVNSAKLAAVEEAEQRAKFLVEDATELLRREIDKLATLLVGSLEGHRWAYASVGFIVGGLLLQTLSGIFGNIQSG